jgi:MFS family permease
MQPYPSRRRRPRFFLLFQQRRAALLTAGGRWTAALPRPVRDRLRWFWFDGAFALGADSISTTYLALYAVALGASSAQVGLLSALSSLTGALFLLPGAFLVERIGRRQRISLAGGFGMRTALLLMAALPFVLHGQPAVLVLLILAALAQAFANTGYPSWVSLIADIVPGEHRGRYFGSRNIVSTAVSMVAAYSAGLLITGNGNPAGYQLAFLLAFLFGAGSVLSYSRIQDPAPEPPPAARTVNPLAALRSVTRHPAFIALCATAAVWNLSLNVASPFFNIYLVRDLHGTAAQVGLLTAASSLAGLPALRFFGPLADRWGPRRVVLLTGLIIPILPFAWVFATSPWHVLFINVTAGILWAGYSLASFNLLLVATPDSERARFSALYQILIALSLAGGAAIGGWVTTFLGYKAAFAISGAGRLLSALLFARFVKERERPA